MKNTIRTDTDEEILEGDIERDNKTDTVRLDECDIIGDEDVQMQMQYLNNKSILRVEHDIATSIYEDQQLNMMMGMDRVFKNAYQETYHNDPGSSEILTNVQLPMSVFVDMDEPEMEEQMQQQKLHGNLYNDFMNL